MAAAGVIRQINKTIRSIRSGIFLATDSQELFWKYKLTLIKENVEVGKEQANITNT
jgi:hypothetical protein